MREDVLWDLRPGLAAFTLVAAAVAVLAGAAVRGRAPRAVVAAVVLVAIGLVVAEAADTSQDALLWLGRWPTPMTPSAWLAVPVAGALVLAGALLAGPGRRAPESRA